MVTANGIANGHATPALAPGHFLFTSESVGEGHPGKLFSLLQSHREI